MEWIEMDGGTEEEMKMERRKEERWRSKEKSLAEYRTGIMKKKVK